MNETVTVFFNSRGRPWEIIRRILETANAQDRIARGPSLTGAYHVTVPGDSTMLETLHMILNQEAIDWYERREKHYSVPELRAFPLMRLLVDAEPKGDGGTATGTQYDYSKACPQCGTGTVQITALRLDPRDLPERSHIVQTLGFQYLVSSAVAEKLRAASVSGLELRQAVSTRDESPLLWWQLIAGYEMPPMAPETTGIVREKRCPTCERGGYFESATVPIEIRYQARQVVLDAIPDCVHTYEHFGVSGGRKRREDVVLPHPLMLVKPKVFDILHRLKVRAIRFDPVRIIDE